MGSRNSKSRLWPVLGLRRLGASFPSRPGTSSTSRARSQAIGTIEEARPVSSRRVQGVAIGVSACTLDTRRKHVYMTPTHRWRGTLWTSGQPTTITIALLKCRRSNHGLRGRLGSDGFLGQVCLDDGPGETGLVEEVDAVFCCLRPYGQIACRAARECAKQGKPKAKSGNFPR